MGRSWRLRRAVAAGKDTKFQIRLHDLIQQIFVVYQLILSKQAANEASDTLPSKVAEEAAFKGVHVLAEGGEDSSAATGDNRKSEE